MWSPSALMSVTLAKSAAAAEEVSPRWWFKEAMASFEVNLRPSWKVASLLSSKVQTVASSLAPQESAMSGPRSFSEVISVR